MVHEPVPPVVFKLRRATDRYMAAGFIAAAVFMWILEVRLVVRDEWLTAAEYLLPTVLMTYAAAGMTRLLFKHWERRPPAEPIPAPRPPSAVEQRRSTMDTVRSTKDAVT